MNRRLAALMMTLLLAVLAIAPAFAEDDSVSPTAGYYYVYTENGKGLNVRDTPGGAVVGSLKYGSRIYCYYNEFGWALIDFKYNKPGYGMGTYACFVSSRYLQKTKPTPRSSGTAAAATAVPTVASISDPLEELNREFTSARAVTPFRITVRPTRASGWVNLRWAPSMSTEVMATYGANAQLLVIKETTNWYQVEDQDTGDVGFIKKEFVSR